MSIYDAAWDLIEKDPRLANARKRLSIHEFRLAVQHIAEAMQEANKPKAPPRGWCGLQHREACDTYPECSCGRVGAALKTSIVGGD